MDKKNIMIKIIENYSPEVEENLSDKNILLECIKTSSFMKKYDEIYTKLQISGRDDKNIKKIMTIILPYVISPGVKGYIRGKKFENIILQHITIICCKYGFSFFREKKHDKYITDEIPDFYIEYDEKVILIFAQIDLWRGGQQLNRGFKYIFNNKYDNTRCKNLCVIASKPNLKSKKSKVYKIFENGLINDTLCYITNLETIICKFFHKYNS